MSHIGNVKRKNKTIPESKLTRSLKRNSSNRENINLHNNTQYPVRYIVLSVVIIIIIIMPATGFPYASVERPGNKF